ncbi:uncharacterized protein LOC122160563 isoform X8 [Centrocercus urophasianus]|uniref:uncharacterized protein LOC122160563 isoform X8 n=1 Tax=Centrocercus urophasianus TaxID=9002 RepID=UPI001C646196|nr:uncharacterized protein LOC122160563 isoform X8 [Centrocercus urophasianus]
MIPIFPRGLLTIVSTKDAEWDILEIFLGGLLKAFHTAYSDHRMLHRSRLQSSLPIITSRENEVSMSTQTITAEQPPYKQSRIQEATRTPQILCEWELLVGLSELQVSRTFRESLAPGQSRKK